MGNLVSKRKTFCFVSHTGRVQRTILDGSVRYRCFHPAEELRRLGHFSVVTSLTEFLANPCFDYDVYVFHRPNCNKQSPTNFTSLINALKAQGKILVADYDDLIFGTEEIALQSSIVKNGNATPEAVIPLFENNLNGLSVFDKVICSTRPLAKWAKHFNPSATVEVMPNFIPSSLLDLHGKNKFYNKTRQQGTIGYFAGTKSHDKDFPVVMNALHRVLSENPLFTLLVVGPVQVPKSIAALDNVHVNPVLNYFRLPSLMWSCETVIAPLETSDFNDCKSRVKYLEASLAGCRLVATPITDMRDIGSDYMQLVENNNEWYEALSFPPNATEMSKLREKNFNFLLQNCQIEALLKLAGV